MTAGDGEAWVDVARALRLEHAHVSEAHVTGTNTSFKTLYREMMQGRMRPGNYGFAPWLYGTRDEVAVIAHALCMKQTGEVAKPTAPTHTVAIAEIDPPLFAGLRMMSRDLGPFLGFPKGDEPTSHPAIDRVFRTTAFDTKRVREVLVPYGNADQLGEAIAEASRSCSVLVKDSTVETIALGATPDVPRIEALVSIAASMAREISKRSRDLKHTDLEIAARTAWQKLAAQLGLSIDPLRWHIFGRLGDVEVSAMLDGSPPAVSTTFRARFRTRLPCPLFLRRGADGKTGFPELNGLLLLVAPHPEQARAILGDVQLRTMLAEEAKTSNLVLDDVEIVLGRGGFAGTKEIAKRLHALVAIVDRMTPGMRVAGPFR